MKMLYEEDNQPDKSGLLLRISHNKNPQNMQPVKWRNYTPLDQEVVKKCSTIQDIDTDKSLMAN